MKVFSVCPRPKARKVIPTRFVCSTPTKIVEGKLEQIYKSRLVALGFWQSYGLDYFDTYAPTASYTTFRTLLAHKARSKNRKIKHVDVERAYLNADLHETIYVEIPKEFKARYPPNSVWLLHKALYGLKQSGREWNSDIHATFVSMGFKPCVSDPCLYVKTDGREIVYILLYVDDIFISYENENTFNLILKDLTNKYRIKNLGDVCKALGLNIHTHSDSTLISQYDYTMSVLRKFGYENTIPSQLPTYKEIPTNIESCELKRLSTHSPSELVGALLWLARLTRPDIAYAVAYLSQHVNDTTMIPYILAAKILKYLRYTATYCIRYKLTHDNLVFYADSDFANCRNTRKSQSGFISFLSGGPISWTSQKQSTVALSSTEAEIYALSIAIQECLFFYHLMREMKMNVSIPFTIYEDNAQTKIRAETNIRSKLLKHIDVRYQFINECVRGGIVKIVKIDTKHNISDTFTKPLPKTQFYHHVSTFMVDGGDLVKTQRGGG